MANPKKRLKQLFEAIDRTYWGAEERALVSEAVALAVEIGDEQLEYQARMRHTASANFVGDTDAVLSSFAWCLSKHDADPRRFPSDIENGAADLMWQFKWMGGSLRHSPAFSSDQIAAVLDDMEQHYRAEGLGMSGVLTARFEGAWSAGRWDEAEALRQRLEATPRDSHSHCDACGRSQFAGYFAETGREADAVRLVEEMLEGGYQCGEEPEHALSRALIPYLRLGRHDEARHTHLRSYRMAKDNADNLAIIANNLVFCAITGNEARALSLLERHIGWLGHDGLNEHGHLRALSAFALVLDSVVLAGHPDAVVRGADAVDLERFFGHHDGEWTASELAPVAWAAAERIAVAFDARNGTDAEAVRLAAVRALADEHYDVPINSDSFTPVAVATQPQDAAARLQRTIDLAEWGAAAEGVAAARRALEDGDALALADRRRLASLLVGGLVALEQIDEARAALPHRIELLHEEGLHAQADLEERVGLGMFGVVDDAVVAALEGELAAAGDAPPATRADLELTLAFARLRADRVDEAIALAEAAADGFDAAGEPGGVSSALMLVVMARAGTGDQPGAGEAVAHILGLPELSDGRRARVLEQRARLNGGLDRFAEGAADADEVCRILATIGAHDALAQANILAAMLHEDAGSPAEAIVRYRTAIRALEGAGVQTTALRFKLGRSMLAAGDAAEAAELLHAVYTEETEGDEPAASRAQTLMQLARACEGAEQYGNALWAWGTAAELAESDDAAPLAGSALVNRGRLLLGLGEPGDAVESLDAAVAIARQHPDQLGLLTDAIHVLGRARIAGDDASGLDLLAEVAELARQHGAAWLLADVTDSRGRGLVQLGRLDEGVRELLAASDAFVEVGDTGAAGGAELFAARSLVGAQRHSDSVSLFRSILDRDGGSDALRRVAALELGDALEALGRHGEAAEARTLADA
jgi:tetratricopeptide (TPR) repeat protein